LRTAINLDRLGLGWQEGRLGQEAQGHFVTCEKRRMKEEEEEEEEEERI